MSKHTTKTVPINEPITILGHTFQGLKEIRDAVEAISSVGHGKMKGNRFVGWDKPYIFTQAPTTRIQGVHVLEIHQRYPCFDSSDYTYEDRYFTNYFFSERPFTKDVIFKLALLPYKGNCELDINELPESFPHIYYVGEGENMKATI